MNIGRNRLIAAKRMYNMDEGWAWFTTLYGGLNSEQRVVYDNIMLTVSENNGGLFFVYESGSTGKTYLWKTIIAWIRSMGKIVLSVASSGIALLLLPGGRTTHSRFRILLELDNESCCGIDHRHAFKAVDRTFRDICKHDNPNADNEVFGGKLVVLGGDLRQILPVIPNAPQAVVVASAINKDEMMRFNNWLLSMGDGTLHSVVIDNEDEATWIEIPDDLLLPTCNNPIEAIVSKKPVFTNGQVYVVSSRVTSRAGLRFYIDNGGDCANNLTQNIVYKEVFYNLPIVNVEQP
uniref:ATP-dependent DNA helicase n=1 Tax=Tanacetum cinerariifolium TaxID=118510 RepID=A0A699GP30_TANCI|nr:hypothetical protein [Tanacetum cinerariifolium]